MNYVEGERLQVGDLHGIYTVVALNTLGPLPLAVINEGEPNAGLTVILRTPFRSLQEQSPT